MLIGSLTPTADEYAASIAPLLASPDIETHSGALFNRKGEPIRPSKGMTTEQVSRLIQASEWRAVGKPVNQRLIAEYDIHKLKGFHHERTTFLTGACWPLHPAKPPGHGTNDP